MTTSKHKGTRQFQSRNTPWRSTHWPWRGPRWRIQPHLQVGSEVHSTRTRYLDQAATRPAVRRWCGTGDDRPREASYSALEGAVLQPHALAESTAGLAARWALGPVPGEPPRSPSTAGPATTASAKASRRTAIHPSRRRPGGRVTRMCSAGTGSPTSGDSSRAIGGSVFSARS